MPRKEALRPAELLDAANAALLVADWQSARVHFEAVVAARPTADALLGLGVAARTSGDFAAATEAHERGYHLARASGDEQVAARLALELVIDCRLLRGPAEAGGWLERAGSLLEALPTSPEHGMLAYLRASAALNEAHDPAAARAFAAGAVAIARTLGFVDGEMVSRALEGLALVSDGAVEEGMRRLDEATAAAVSGEIAQPELIGQVLCHLIDACKRVRDLDRAGEWCRRVEELAARFGDADMFAICRIHYGELQLWRSEWHDADATLTSVARDFPQLPGRAVGALVRLAELRRRQGRIDEANALLEEAQGHPLAPLVRSALAFDRSDPEEAAAQAELFLRRVPPGDRFERVPALELLVRAQLACGRTDEAARAAGELATISDAAPTALLRAAALLARGRLDAAGTPAQAAAALEDASDLFAETGALYEAGRTRLELAAALRAAGRDEHAVRAEEQGRAALEELGLRQPGRSRDTGTEGLTRREQDVLRLVAEGRANSEIAATLFLSVRTVEHHVASIYAKLGVSGRTARAAATAYALRHGLA